MEYYPYALQFPFSKTILNFREINCLEQSILCKINNTLPPSSEYRSDYFEVLLEILQQVLKNKQLIYNLDIVEFLMFVIKLRAVSVGSFIEFAVGEEEKRKKIKFDLYNLLKNIYAVGQMIEEHEIVEKENVIIKIKWPDLHSEYQFLKLESQNNMEKFLSSICEFVDYIKIKDQLFNFKFCKSKEKQELFEILPVSIKDIIQTNVISLLKKISELPLFELQEFENYKFEFYNYTIQDMVRFVFANNENNLIAENVFLLNKGFTMKDIDSLAPITKQNYINYFIEQNNKNEEVQ